MKNKMFLAFYFLALSLTYSKAFAGEAQDQTPQPLAQYSYAQAFGGKNQLHDLEKCLQNFPSYQRSSLCREDVIVQTLKITHLRANEVGKEQIYSCEFENEKLFLTSISKLGEWIYPRTVLFPSELPVIVLLYNKDNVKTNFLALHVHRKLILNGKTILPQSEIEPEPIKPAPPIITAQSSKQPEKIDKDISQPVKTNITRATLLKAAGLVALSAAIIWNFDQVKFYFSQFMRNLLPSLFAQK